MISLQCLAQRDSTSHQIKLGIFGGYEFGFGANHTLLIHKKNKYFSISSGIGSSSSPYPLLFSIMPFLLIKNLGEDTKLKKMTSQLA